MTKTDYCIIFIGEYDFQKTYNYIELVQYIRDKLSSLNNTNIILCLPTFKCSVYNTMYNSRLELFNNLLYLDNETHAYAYILDSNLNLTYDGRMFNQRYGTLNVNGLKVVLTDLKELIINIDCNENYYDVNSVIQADTPKEAEDNQYFFL